MIAKRLESLLSHEAAKTGISLRSPADMVQRFQSLRGFGILPKGRGKNARHLSLTEIAAGILSITTEKPGYAGTVSKLLTDLRPVGGIEASFMRCGTLGKAIETVLADSDAMTSLIEIRVSDSEFYTNGYGRGTIKYHSGGTKKAATYVGKTAVSLLKSGAEKNFDPRALISSVITETVFYPPFFRYLDRELQREANSPAALIGVDPEEDDEETKKEERTRRLGLTANSRYLNLAVDNQVTWPREETAVDFEGYKLVLMPKTRENTTSIHIDLHGQRISPEDATTVINRFLSILAWCDDQFAVLQEGWYGNPVPVPVPKRNLAFTTAYQWIFDRKVPQSPEARKALAIYREGRNAQQNYQISYAVLSYYKIIETKYHRDQVKNWFRDNYELVRKKPNLANSVAAFEAARGSETPQEYIHTACRTAVAHANKPYTTDPDDTHELRRLYVVADILRALARIFIQKEFNISDCMYDGT